MTLEIENKLSELLELLSKADDKYDIAHVICFEVICYGSNSHKEALNILTDVGLTYQELVEDMCEEHSDEKN